MNDLRLA